MIRIPPQAVEVEKHVLGAMLLDGEAAATVSGMLTREDFYVEFHQKLFQLCSDLVARQIPVDMVTVFDEAKRRGQFGQLEKLVWEITAEVVSSANVDQHCRIVREKAVLRRLILASTKIMESAYQHSQDARGILQEAESEILAIGNDTNQEAGLQPMRTLLKDALEEFQQVAEGRELGVMSNIRALDDLIRGFRPGTLNVLAARPGVGKSALALQVAANCRVPVALYSLEMLAQEQIERLISQRIDGLDGDALRSPAVLKAKQAALSMVMAELLHLPIQICDSSRLSPASILSQCRRMQRKDGLGLIIVDYLQLVEASGKHQSREQEVGSISGFLKRIANELQVPVLAVAALSRKCEDREDKRPIKSDLRESGQLESDAHSLIFLYRESDYSARAAKDQNVKNITEVLIRKNRGGKTGRTLLLFNGAQSKFSDLAAQSQQQYWNFMEGKEFQGEEF